METAFHSLLGGVALAAAVAAEGHGHGAVVGLGTALVIILHKPFDAIAVSTLMAASGCTRFARHLLNGCQVHFAADRLSRPSDQSWRSQKERLRWPWARFSC